MTKRHITGALLAVAAAGVLAGCGGGGGGDTAAAPVDTGVNQDVAQGVAAGQSAAQALTALGSPGAVDTSRAGSTVGGYDSFGTPNDVFEQQVSDDTSGSTNGAEDPATAPSVSPDVPVVSPPNPSTPTTTTGDTPATPGTPTPETPVTSVKALEADFDVSGEPVVAREGDAIPPDTQQFTVKTVGADKVVLQLNAGLLPDGSDTVTLDEGESITLYNQTAKQSYKIRLVDVRSVN